MMPQPISLADSFFFLPACEVSINWCEVCGVAEAPDDENLCECCAYQIRQEQEADSYDAWDREGWN